VILSEEVECQMKSSGVHEANAMIRDAATVTSISGAGNYLLQ
jgi:hypothetical protein